MDSGFRAHKSAPLKKNSLDLIITVCQVLAQKVGYMGQKIETKLLCNWSGLQSSSWRFLQLQTKTYLFVAEVIHRLYYRDI